MLHTHGKFSIGHSRHKKAAPLHVKIQARKRAPHDLKRHVGDPRLAEVPAAGLLSKAYAKQRASLIDARKANCDAEPGQPPPGHTTYLTVVDKDGNITSWIQSISDIWGSGIAVEGM